MLSKNKNKKFLYEGMQNINTVDGMEKIREKRMKINNIEKCKQP